MAGEWIKVELSLPQKPEVIRIGRALGISSEAVCGWLIKFWGWVGANSVDGVVDGVVDADVDMVLGLPGFADALVAVNWLSFDAARKQMVIPNFQRHNGESAKKRALKTSRQSKWRGSVDAPVDAVVDAPVVQKVPLEKRREEKRKIYIRDDWMPSETTAARLVKEFGLAPDGLTRYVSAFRDICKAKDYKYADFDAAFANCVRQDWPKMRGKDAPVTPRRVSI